MNIFERMASEDDFDDYADTFSHSSEEEETSLPKKEMNIFESLNVSQKEEKPESFGFLDTLIDVGKQVVAKGVSGALGSYGNILDTFGAQLKQGETLPGQNQLNQIQSQILEKTNRGEVPSYGELMLLSDEDTLPSGLRFPTSKEVQGGIETLTGVGEGRTAAGRIAGRGAEFLGESAVLPGGGVKALASVGGAGLAGQSVRELGGPEGLATATEIVGSIVPSAIQGKVAPRRSSTKELAEAGRKIGLTEKQITPLAQSEKKVAALSKVARKGEKTKELFSSIKESLGDSYTNIKSNVSTIKGIGAENESNLLGKFTNIRNDLSKTLKASPDKEAAIKFIDDAIEKVASNGASPEELINFWQDINKSVKWNSIQGGKKSLAALKEPILNTLEKVAPEAAKDFELTNKLYSKYAQISKKLKPDVIESFLNKAEILGIPAAGFALAQGNPWVLAGLASESSVRLLAREMLINPYFQNIAEKTVKNFNSSSFNAIKQSTKQAKEFMDKKYPDEDWSFLNE
jgi:hypothetical protein